MNIVFTGAQSTGKTTLLNIMRDWEMFKDYTFYDNIVRKIKAEGFDINREGDVKTQFRIAREFEKIAQDSNSVSERCMIDCFTYSFPHFNDGKISADQMRHLETMMLTLVEKYDYIFYLRPEFEPIEDGVRDLDKEFVDYIADKFDEIILSLMRDPKIRPKIKFIYGSIDERVNQIKEVLGC